MCNEIISKVNSEYDMLLEEIDVESIIRGKTEFYDEYVVRAVENMVQDYVTDLLNSIRERGVDTNCLYRFHWRRLYSAQAIFREIRPFGTLSVH